MAQTHHASYLRIDMNHKRFHNNPAGSWIRSHVEGKSFADIGGLWGTVGERATVAHKHGASSVAMIDAMPLDSHWWSEFYRRLDELNIRREDISCQSQDLQCQSFPDTVGAFEFVHCSGVLYHLPNVLLAFHNLRKVSKDYLCISSQIVPSQIKNSRGTLTTEAGQAILVPTLTDENKEILREYYATQNFEVTHINRDGPAFYENDVFSYGPTYWLPTVEMLVSLLSMFSFECIEEQFVNEHQVFILAKKL